MRTVGPWLREHRIARDNLTAAFPEKSPQEIEAICPAPGTISDASRRSSCTSTGSRSWTAKSRTRCDVVYDDVAVERFDAIPTGSPPRGLSSARISATGSCRRGSPALRRRLHLAVLSRRPTSAPIADAIVEDCGRAAWARWCRRDSTRRSAGARARTRRQGRHAGRSVRLARHRHHVLRPRLQGVAAAGATRPPSRLPDPWRAHGAPGRPEQVLGRDHRSDRAGARRRGQDRHRRHHPGRSPM